MTTVHYSDGIRHRLAVTGHRQTRFQIFDISGGIEGQADNGVFFGTVAKLAMRQPFVLFKGLTFQKLCL
ncbi:hypothetical protein RAG41_28705, partial [Klebsiella pneumoniae]